jgi:hypothetical protein
MLDDSLVKIGRHCVRLLVAQQFSDLLKLTACQLL